MRGRFGSDTKIGEKTGGMYVKTFAAIAGVIASIGITSTNAPSRSVCDRIRTKQRENDALLWNLNHHPGHSASCRLKSQSAVCFSRVNGDPAV
jgi:hypothetical protein